MLEPRKESHKIDQNRHKWLPGEDVKRSSFKDLLERILPVSPQDLLTRTCARSCRDLCEDVSRIFTKSSHTDLYKIMQGPLTGFHQDLHNFYCQGPLQDLGQGFIVYYGPLRLHHETLAVRSP